MDCQCLRDEPALLLAVRVEIVSPLYARKLLQPLPLDVICIAEEGQQVEKVSARHPHEVRVTCQDLAEGKGPPPADWLFGFGAHVALEDGRDGDKLVEVPSENRPEGFDVLGPVV